MADLNDPLPGSNVSTWSMIAMAAGSLLTLRSMNESSAFARVFAVVSSFLIAYFSTPAVTEWMGASHKQERIIGLLVAFLGLNILAGVATFAEKFRHNPQEAFAWLWSLWRGGRP